MRNHPSIPIVRLRNPKAGRYDGNKDFDSFLFSFFSLFTILIDELRTNRSYAETYPPVLRWVVDRYQLRKINSPAKCCTGFNEFLIKSRARGEERGREKERRGWSSGSRFAARKSIDAQRNLPLHPSPRLVCAVNIRNS